MVGSRDYLRYGCDEMTDIVARLRDFDNRCMGDNACDVEEAADEIESLRQQLAECQAREKVLRDALEYINPQSRNAALAMPSDSTALDAMKKQWQREALLEAIAVSNETAQKLGIHQPTAFMYEVVLSKMAKDLET